MNVTFRNAGLYSSYTLSFIYCKYGMLNMYTYINDWFKIVSTTCICLYMIFNKTKFKNV